MTVTTLSTHPQMAEAEWQTRCDLAALYHILHYYRMTDMIYTHMTARIPGEGNLPVIEPAPGAYLRNEPAPPSPAVRKRRQPQRGKSGSAKQKTPSPEKVTQ